MEIRGKLENIWYCFIDEFSMLSAQDVFEISTNLGIALKPQRNHIMGGLSTLWMGDSLQLPPICATALHAGTANKSQSAQMGLRIWDQVSTTTVLLSQNMRQNDCPVSARIFDDIRFGRLSREDYERLSCQVLGGGNLTVDRCQDGIFLFGKKRHVEVFNRERHATQVQAQDGKEHVFNSLDALQSGQSNMSRGIESALRAAEETSTGNLVGSLSLTLGDKIALRYNLAPKFGLATNARGTVVGFVHDDDVCGCDHPDGRDVCTVMPLAVLVRFDKITLPESHLFIGGEFGDSVVPIMRVTRTFEFHRTWIRRTMIPLRLDYASTIHCAQAATFDGPVIVDVNSCHYNARLPYVALTRVRSIEQLIFLRPFTFAMVNKKLPKVLANDVENVKRSAERTLMANIQIWTECAVSNDNRPPVLSEFNDQPIIE
jgi:hypothetical protein